MGSAQLGGLACGKVNKTAALMSKPVRTRLRTCRNRRADLSSPPPVMTAHWQPMTKEKEAKKRAAAKAEKAAAEAS